MNIKTSVPEDVLDPAPSRISLLVSEAAQHSDGSLAREAVGPTIATMEDCKIWFTVSIKDKLQIYIVVDILPIYRWGSLDIHKNHL